MAEVKINKEELQEWIKQQKLTYADVSRYLGFDAGYISKSVNKEKMSSYGYKALIRAYGLPDGSFIKKEYVPQCPTKEEEVKETKSLQEEIISLLKYQNSLLEEINVSLRASGGSRYGF